MANTNTALIPKILSRTMAPLRERCPLARTVFSDFSSEVAEFGNTIDVKIWPAATTGTVTPGPVDPTPSNTTPAVVQIALNQWPKSDFHLTDKELMEIDASAHFIPPALDEAARALANVIEASIATALKNVTYGYVGTAGTTPFATDTSAAVNARKTLALQICPPAPRYGIVDANAEANMLSLAAFQDADKAGDTGPKIDGEIGRKFGINWMYSDFVPTHTLVGDDCALDDSAARAVGLKTLHMDGLSTAPAAGDIFTIAGDTQTYVVTSSTTLAGTDSDVSFEPGLKVAIPAADGNEVVTFKTTHVANLVYHPKACGLAMRPVRVPSSRQDTMMSITDPETGLSLTLSVLDQYHQTTWELSALYGVKGIRGEYSCRIAG